MPGCCPTPCRLELCLGDVLPHEVFTDKGICLLLDLGVGEWELQACVMSLSWADKVMIASCPKTTRFRMPCLSEPIEAKTKYETAVMGHSSLATAVHVSELLDQNHYESVTVTVPSSICVHENPLVCCVTVLQGLAFGHWDLNIQIWRGRSAHWHTGPCFFLAGWATLRINTNSHVCHPCKLVHASLGTGRSLCTLLFAHTSLLQGMCALQAQSILPPHQSETPGPPPLGTWAEHWRPAHIEMNEALHRLEKDLLTCVQASHHVIGVSVCETIHASPPCDFVLGGAEGYIEIFQLCWMGLCRLCWVAVAIEARSHAIVVAQDAPKNHACRSGL